MNDLEPGRELDAARAKVADSEKEIDHWREEAVNWEERCWTLQEVLRKASNDIHRGEPALALRDIMVALSAVPPAESRPVACPECGDTGIVFESTAFDVICDCCGRTVG